MKNEDKLLLLEGLKVLLDNISFIGNDSTESRGLCSLIINSNVIFKTTTMQRSLLKAHIQLNRPSAFSSLNAYRHRHYGYYWKPGEARPRKKWLIKEIKKLEKQTI
jgi:hypothetical protein